MVGPEPDRTSPPRRPTHLWAPAGVTVVRSRAGVRPPAAPWYSSGLLVRASPDQPDRVLDADLDDHQVLGQVLAVGVVDVPDHVRLKDRDEVRHRLCQAGSNGYERVIGQRLL